MLQIVKFQFKDSIIATFTIRFIKIIVNYYLWFTSIVDLSFESIAKIIIIFKILSKLFIAFNNIVSSRRNIGLIIISAYIL